MFAQFAFPVNHNITLNCTIFLIHFSPKKAQDSRILSLAVNLGTTQQRHHEPAKESNISKTHDVLLAKNTYSDAKEEHAVEVWSRAGVGKS